MKYPTPTTAAQMIAQTNEVMAMISRIRTTTEINHTAGNYSMALTATSSAASDYSNGLCEGQKMRVCVLALRWAIDVMDVLSYENPNAAQGDAAYEVFDTAGELVQTAWNMWDDAGALRIIKTTQVQKALFANE